MPKVTATALTDAAVSRIAAAPKGGRVERRDRLAPGLFVRVNDKGTKRWLVDFRLDGKLRKVALGEWPAMSVKTAREAAREAREAASAGLNPREAREAERAARKREVEIERERSRTFGGLAELYIARETPRLREGRNVASLIRRHLLPALGDVRLSELRRRHIVGMTDALIDADMPAAAAKAHTFAKRITSWAVERDELSLDPLAGLRPPVEPKKRERVLTHAELRTLWAAWTVQGYPFGTLQKFLALTGLRRSEAAKATWSELDDPERPTLWMIPAERMKGRRDHVLPLPRAVSDLFISIPRFGGSFIFSTTAGTRPISGFSKAKAATDALAAQIAADQGGEPPADWIFHDLRRTLRTGVARLGIPEEVNERILAHATGGLIATYNRHRYAAEMLEALERWADELLRIVGESEREAVEVPQKATS